MHRYSVLASTAIVLVTLVLPLAGIVSAQTDGITVVAGLNGSQGVLVAPDGSIWVAEAGTGGPNTVTITNSAASETEVARLGDTARVLKVGPDGQQTDVAWLPSLARPTAIQGASRLELLGGDIYVTAGWWNADGGPTPPQPNMATISRIQDGQAIPVASSWDFEATNNPDGFERDSHPCGIVAGPDGMLWVADAGANAILKLDPRSGQVQLAVPLADLQAAQPNPARGSLAQTAPVPTGITLGADGDVYVALLPGFPFVPGSAKVLHIGRDGSVSDFQRDCRCLPTCAWAPMAICMPYPSGSFVSQAGC